MLALGLVVLSLIVSTGPVATHGQTGTATPTPPSSSPTAGASTPSAGATAPAAGATAVPTQSAQAGDRYFPETGYRVPGNFIKYWDSNGGLPVFGYPISEARIERSLTDNKDYLVQYFERNRFEYHPEFKDSPNEVLLGLLGVELTVDRTFDSVAAFPDTADKIYMAPTKHSLGEPFLSYWRKNGGLGIFGYPISEPFNEKNAEDGKTYLVQYFQRNRFEYHPENKPPYDVLLGLLGRDFMEMQAVYMAWGPPIPGGIPIVRPLKKPAKPAIGTKFLTGPTVGDGMIVHAFYQDQNRIMS